MNHRPVLTRCALILWSTLAVLVGCSGPAGPNGDGGATDGDDSAPVPDAASADVPSSPDRDGSGAVDGPTAGVDGPSDGASPDRSGPDLPSLDLPGADLPLGGEAGPPSDGSPGTPVRAIDLLFMVDN